MIQGLEAFAAYVVSFVSLGREKLNGGTASISLACGDVWGAL